jgi:hypothetical protein
MPDQDTKPTSVQESSEVEQAPKVANTLTWLIPLLVCIVIIVTAVLAALGPAVGTVYTNIAGTL